MEALLHLSAGEASTIFSGSLGLLWHMLWAVIARGGIRASRNIALQVRLLVIQAVALNEFALVLATALVDDVVLSAHVDRE